MFPLSKRTSLAVAVGVAVVATGLTLGFGASSAGALPVAGQAKTTVPGDNGDVKIHNSTTPVDDPRNEPHVCIFYLAAFNFDSLQSVTWWITAWPPTGDGTTVVDQGTITLDSSGNGFTADQTLPNGHYKLFWTFVGQNGAPKHKVFWVSCPTTPPTSPPPTTMSPPPTTMTPPPTTMTPPPTTMTPPPTTMTPPPTTMTPSPTMTSATATASPTPPPPPPPAPTPTPVQTTLPVTG